MTDDWLDRDYSTEFPITLSWADWNRVHSLVVMGLEASRSSVPEEAYEEGQAVRERLTLAIGEASPGNGIDDWPDSMKAAYNEVVREMIRELRQEGDG